MKTLHYIIILFSYLSLSASSCKKDKTGIDALPAATQEGKNTFGFLLNGEVWTPKAPILRSKLDLSYDPGYENGTLSIVAIRYEGDFSQYISIGNSQINKLGKYDLFAYFDDDKTRCSYEVDKSIPVGKIIISKLDLTGHGVISGTFEFKLEKDGCPTINATEGRFDLTIE